MDTFLNEEAFLKPVADWCGDQLCDLLKEANDAYPTRLVCLKTRKRFATLYAAVRDVGLSMDGSPSVHRDCGPQLLVLALEKLTPESFLLMISECEDVRVDLLWGFFGEAAPPTGDAEAHCWIRSPLQTQPRGSPQYNAIMRLKMMSMAVFIINSYRSVLRYEGDKVRFSTYASNFSNLKLSELKMNGNDAPLLVAADQVLGNHTQEFMTALKQLSMGQTPDGDTVCKVAAQCTPALLRQLILAKTADAVGPGSNLLGELLEVWFWQKSFTLCATC